MTPTQIGLTDITDMCIAKTLWNQSIIRLCGAETASLKRKPPHFTLRNEWNFAYNAQYNIAFS